ncbi:MAG TPA: FAD-dependent oxidoreductase, partial [Candidatus Nitrosotalea sp.]|nr:FAD-dependent oxidoreductase [Candidatus Nitrosotalea sp.]
MIRERFIRNLGAAAVGAVAMPEFVAWGTSQARDRERIVIVGAGIAGIVTAMHLRDAGIESVIYESSARLGGRMHSERSYWNEGQHTEWCGAMVDSTHVNIHRLARRFGVGLLDTHAARPPHARDTCYLDGRYYSMSQADRDFAKIWPILQSQLGGVASTTTYANATPTARKLDAMSMRDWIVQYVPGGLDSQLGRLIAESYRNEYGRDITELSALNLVLQLGQQTTYAENEQLNVLGYSDQRYILATGSQSLPEAIAASLPPGSVRFEHRLLALRRMASGAYELRFDRRGSRETVYADRVVLAIPFIGLRSLDYSSAGFDSAKINAIENLGYGYHTKLHLQ